MRNVWNLVLCGAVSAALACTAASEDGASNQGPDAAATSASADGSVAQTDGGTGSDAGRMDAGSPADAATGTDAGDRQDAGGNADAGDGGPANIATVLDSVCGAPGTPSVPPGTQLQKLTLTASDALCNDGTSAVAYVRRALSPAAEGRWVIVLEGGGGCVSAEECADRWCGVQGGYNAGKMSSAWARPAMAGTGILEAAPGNPLNQANQVYVPYCSSDFWTGQRSAHAMAPAQGAPYTIHFQGHGILQALISTLQTDAGARSDDASQTLPDLDTASMVVLSGTSSGAWGAVFHLDWLRGQLASSVEVRGLFDAGFDTAFAVAAQPLQAGLLQRQLGIWDVFTRHYDAFVDQSCLTLTPAAERYKCSSTTYLNTNHVTSPFLTRVDLTDSVAAQTYADLGQSGAVFPTDVLATLGLYASAASTGVEAGSISTTPGIYAPNCGRHSALTNNVWFRTATVDDTSGTATSMRAATAAWLMGNTVDIRDTHPATTSVCPGGSGGTGGDTTEPFPMDRGSQAGAPDSYRGLPMQLVDNGEPVVTPVRGKVGVVCIGPSFMNMECGNWIQRLNGGDLAGQAAAQVVVVNCGVSGAGLDAWDSPMRDADLWGNCINLLAPAGLSADQVRVVYAKAVNDNSMGTAAYPDPSADYFDILDNLDVFSGRIASFFPSVTAAYMTSRSYGGFTATSSEPRPYETGHALNTWLALNPAASSIWFGWGAYIWAPDCTTGITNNSGVCYDRSDYAADGAHPVATGRIKVSQMMHDRLLQEAWYRP